MFTGVMSDDSCLDGDVKSSLFSELEVLTDESSDTSSIFCFFELLTLSLTAIYYYSYYSITATLFEVFIVR